ncbi:unnamed protein product [Staurois parvus]|uniref:Uncharacterized protein n=1 Tax=Staurois parvus TaxID=386267 RepID=A0ABN9ENY6_9NEOB|nr:unnamed protein product [Staurois parvus]
MGTDTENDTRHPGQEKWDCAESIHTEWGQIPRMTPGIQDRRSGTVQSPYIQNGDDTENDTRHPGQEKWDCAGIHT